MYFSKINYNIYSILNLVNTFVKVKLKKKYLRHCIILLSTGALGGLGLVWCVVVHEAVVRYELSEVKLGVKWACGTRRESCWRFALMTISLTLGFFFIWIFISSNITHTGLTILSISWSIEKLTSSWSSKKRELLQSFLLYRIHRSTRIHKWSRKRSLKRQILP